MKSHSAAHAVNKNLQFCNEPFSCSCCNQYLMFWSNKMKSYSAAIAVNKNLQFMQYTLSTLLSSFPWTTQKSIIVENSKIVENFGATIFSTIMEFDCIYSYFVIQAGCNHCEYKLNANDVDGKQLIRKD